MKFTKILIVLCLCLFITAISSAQEKTVFPGADETTPSRSEYFSWINNTNEGSTEAQTLIDLDFFKWLFDEYGMKLDIYAFDAGAIDGKRFYGSIHSDRFKEQFPRGFAPMVEKAASVGTRLGVWGGPDGFGNTPEEEAARFEQMVSLCRDHHFALFKFDAVCGPLRPEKEDMFIRMMTECRRYSPDLILLNHRLGLERAQAQATTFLWEGKETYIDVFSTNRITAPHHRADALSRGLVPDLRRLTEDHGVCISSCPDFWDDDLILQAFNRALILSPQIYGNPWLLRDDEFPKLARIFNLHRKYRQMLVKGMVLPGTYGPFAVSRGDGRNRLLTLRNLTWEPIVYTIKLDAEIGLDNSGASAVHCRQFHPTERILGTFKSGATVQIEIPPFRSCLLLATVESCDEPGIAGCDYEVIRNIPGKPVIIDLIALPGTSSMIRLDQPEHYQSVTLNGRSAEKLLCGREIVVKFKGRCYQEALHRKVTSLHPCDIPAEAKALYEASIFAADNNALEVRSIQRSGISKIPQVKAAQDAFFNQKVFKERGIWDQDLFDGDMETGFWPSRKYGADQRVDRGCLRLDLGKITDVDQIVLHTPDEYSLQPLLNDEGNHVEVSTDLKAWKRLTYLAGKRMVIDIDEPVRYLRFRLFPDRLVEIEGFKNGMPLSRMEWRASNLFAHPGRKKPVKAWTGPIVLDEYVKNSRLCIALEGIHGVEGAYAAVKIGDQIVGCPDRAASYPSNTWEYINARRDRNYTYYLPLSPEMAGKTIEVFCIAYDSDKCGFKPEVWLTTYPLPYSKQRLVLERK